MKRALAICLAATITLTPAEAQLFGPGKFKIERVADRFSTDGTSSIVGKNNRISKKSPAGGVYIDAEGVYLDPSAVVRQSDGTLESVALLVHNEAQSDTLFGNGNSLGVLRQVTFILNGGPPVALAVTDASNRGSDTAHYNTITHSASSAFSEGGVITLSPEQFHQIANASTIAIKVEGSNRSVVFDEREIAKNFLANLRTFEAALSVRGN